MKIGIVAALQNEFKTLIRGNFGLQEPIKLTDNIYGIISGMGSSNANQAARILKEKYPGIEAIISWGVAAGLTPNLSTGDVILPKFLVFAGNENYKIKNPLLISLEQKLSNFSFVKLEKSLANTDKLLIDTASKKKLHQETFAEIADMETVTLFEFTRRNKLSFTAIRAISDSLDDEIPASVANYTNEDGSIKIGGFLSEIATNPAQWKHLINIGMNFRKATKRLSIIAKIVLNRD